VLPQKDVPHNVQANHVDQMDVEDTVGAVATDTTAILPDNVIDRVMKKHKIKSNAPRISLPGASVPVGIGSSLPVSANLDASSRPQAPTKLVVMQLIRALADPHQHRVISPETMGRSGDSADAIRVNHLEAWYPRVALRILSVSFPHLLRLHH
jgi:hypothetical protein